MNIRVVFFASLRERMGRSTCEVTLNPVTNVADLWKKLSGDNEQDDVLCAVNRELSSYDHRLQDGDEVAFFPPVTGG